VRKLWRACQFRQFHAKTIRSQINCFTPLCNDDGECEIVPEGLVTGDSNEAKKSIWLCERCYRSLLARKTPTFCRSSGFRIASVPTELAQLNRMESRLIGLGISFTTCVNLYRDGQEFTRGNAINYWNEPAQMVIKLPRPLSKSGVVFLASKTDSATNYFRVRPDLIRRALRWLIANNPLYKHIRISEENLRELEESFANQEVPTIPVTDDEVNELRGHDNHVHIESQTTAPISIDHKAISTANEAGEASDADTPGTVDDGANFCGRDEIHCVTESRGAVPSTASNLSDASESEEDLLENLTESFELEVDQGSKQSEMEHILSAVGVNASDHKIPTGELRRRQDTIDEYKTKQLMQCCFPTLFPDGSGGYYPVDESESRLHEYTLTDYCAHLMK